MNGKQKLKSFTFLCFFHLDVHAEATTSTISTPRAESATTATKGAVTTATTILRAVATTTSASPASIETLAQQHKQQQK